MTKLQKAYNEFIADFCERHGECQATCEEAYERANNLVEAGKSVAALARDLEFDETEIENLMELLPLSSDERYIVARSVEVSRG